MPETLPPLRLDRVRAAIGATVWAILPEKLEAILEVVEHHAAGGAYSDAEITARLEALGGTAAAGAAGAAGRRGAAGSPVTGSVAVIPMMGTMAQRIGAMERASGGTSTEEIGRQFDAALRNPDVGAIVLHIDSPGGSVAGVPELAAKIRAARGQGKRIVAVADTLMASAAYWTGSAADEVVAAPSALVGSIGVFSVHVDATQASERMGLKRTIVRAGRYKAEGNPWEPLSDEARAAMQAQVDELYEQFTADVAAQRGTSPKAVRAGYGEGRVLSAKQAVAAGLVDRVATLDDVLAELTGRRAAGATPGTKPGARAAGVALTLEALGEQVDVPQVGLAPAASSEPVASEAAPAHSPASPAAVDPSLSPALPTSPAPEARSHPVPEHIEPAATGAAATTTPAPAITVGADRARCDYVAIAQAYGQSLGDVARWQASSMSEAQVRADIMDRARGSVAPMSAAAPTTLELSAQEQQRYSIGRAVQAQASGDWTRAGFEREVSATIAKRLGRAAAGFYVPTNVPLFNAAVMQTGTAGKGAELVMGEYKGFVDLLRPRSVLARLGARMETGLVGTYSFIRQTGGSAVSWVGQAPVAGPDESDLDFELVESNPKTAAGLLRYTKQQLAQSVESFDALVRRDLLAAHATAMDKVGIAGSGAAGQPLGVAGYAGVGTFDFGNVVPSYGRLVDMKSKIEVADAQDVGTRAWLHTVELGAILEQTPRMGNTAALPIKQDGKIAGFTAEESNNIPARTLVHGVFSELLLLEWGALDITVDPYTLAQLGIIRVISHHMMNVELQQPKAFVVADDAVQV